MHAFAKRRLHQFYTRCYPTQPPSLLENSDRSIKHTWAAGLVRTSFLPPRCGSLDAELILLEVLIAEGLEPVTFRIASSDQGEPALASAYVSKGISSANQLGHVLLQVCEMYS